MPLAGGGARDPLADEHPSFACSLRSQQVLTTGSIRLTLRHEFPSSKEKITVKKWVAGAAHDVLALLRPQIGEQLVHDRRQCRGSTGSRGAVTSTSTNRTSTCRPIAGPWTRTTTFVSSARSTRRWSRKAASVSRTYPLGLDTEEVDALTDQILDHLRHLREIRQLDADRALAHRHGQSHPH